MGQRWLSTLTLKLLSFGLCAVQLCLANASTAMLSGEITLLAGTTGDSAATNGPVASARFEAPQGIAVDRFGNIFISDGHAIRKLSAAGQVTTLAGRVDEWGSTDGAGGVARFNNPQGLAVSAAGNVYVADRDNQTIRKITPAGFVSTLAGSADSTGSSDGIGTAARFFRPSAVAVDASGNVFVADTRNFTLRKISPAGVVTTIAGRAPSIVDSEPGYADGPARAARFGFIEGIAVDSAGNVYVADNSSHVIRKLNTRGVVSTVAGQAYAMGSVDDSGARARFFYPSGIAVDATGTLYVADSHARIVRRVSPSGLVTTLAGLADHQEVIDGRGSDARFNSLHALALDQRGNVLVTDFVDLPRSSNGGYYQAPGPSGVIRRIDTSENVTTIAGRGTAPEGSNDGAANVARFEEATGIAASKAGALYVTDMKAGTIRRISLAGEVTTLAGKDDVHGHRDGPAVDARFNQPTGIAVDDAGAIYVTDPVASVVRRIGTDGVVTTWAGSPGIRGAADGIGAAARFHTPWGIAVDKHGNVFVSDEWEDVIRMITPAGQVTTLAGRAGQHGSADGPGNMARFDVPGGLTLDPSGNLYVCDYGNRAIRKITPQGLVSTVAERAGLRGILDRIGHGARFDNPTAIAVDDLGNLYVADAYTVRRVTPAGVVTTIAGVPDQPGLKLGPTPGRLNSVGGLALIDSRTLALTQGQSVVKIAF